MIKVYHLIKGLGRGGAEMLLPETLRTHDAERFDFRYAYFLPHKGQVAEDLRELGKEVDCFAATNNLAILAKVPAVARKAREWGADVIHCHLPIAGVVGRLVGRLTGIPIVYTEHNKQERYHVATRKLNLATLGWNKYVIACSGDVKESIDRHKDMNGTPVTTLLNAVNTDRFTPSGDHGTRGRARNGINIPEDRTVIGTVCVFRTQKRLDRWIALAKRLADDYPKLHFAIVGDGPEEDMLRGRIREYGLDERVTLPGRIAEVRPWLAAMDIYLMTSEFEGLPIAMMEAMSSGLPVVATRAGGIGEAITDGEDGFLTEIEEWEQLEAPLRRLIEDTNLCTRIGTAARERIKRDFSIERMTAELEAIYEQVSKA